MAIDDQEKAEPKWVATREDLVIVFSELAQMEPIYRRAAEPFGSNSAASDSAEALKKTLEFINKGGPDWMTALYVFENYALAMTRKGLAFQRIASVVRGAHSSKAEREAYERFKAGEQEVKVKGPSELPRLDISFKNMPEELKQLPPIRMSFTPGSSQRK